MSVTTDQALRSALTDVVAGQPAAPHDRIDSVRRRHVRRRQSQLAALGTAAVVAVAGATLGVLSVRSGGDDGTQFAKRNVPSWALQWPDARDPSIPQKVLDGAVDAWSHAAGGIVIDYADSAAPIPDAQQVIWYRAAKVANASKIAVMFEVSSVYGHQLVVGYASSDEVIDGQPGYDVTNAETPWILSVVDAPTPSERLVFGLNVTGQRSAGSDTFGGNEIVVFADPHARSFEWHVTGADGQVHRAASPMDVGFAAVDTGQISDRVWIDAVRDREGNVLAHDFAVGVPGAADSYQPQLAEVPAFTDVPDSPYDLGASAGQGPSGFETQAGRQWPMHGTTIYARCYGGDHIVVSIDSEDPGHRVVIPCDDREHVVDGPPLLAHSELASEGNGPSHSYILDASQETAWRVEVIAH